MARTIGERPKIEGLTDIWDFVHRDLPDYIYGVFDPDFSLNEQRHECDVALFIPHMGVFLMDVYLPRDLEVEDGRLYSVYGHNRRPFEPEMEKRRMLDRRYRVLQYLKKMYHFSPFVFEMSCYPLVDISTEARKEMGKTINLEHVLFHDDFRDPDAFLLRIHEKYLRERRLASYQNAYSEMMDDMAYQLFACWGVGMPDPPRPDKPPVIFLSYNRNNQIRAWEIKKELEERGIFTWRAPEDVTLSRDYRILETEAIRNCDALLILLSSSSMESDEVLYEFETARKFGKAIIPLIIEDVEMTDYYKKNLSHVQYRKMINNDSNVFNEIAELIREEKKNRDE